MEWYEVLVVICLTGLTMAVLLFSCLDRNTKW
jgi:hypothetical protein